MPAAPLESGPIAEELPLRCDHCNVEMEASQAVSGSASVGNQQFCCHGCALAYQFIRANGLQDFYRRRQQFDADANRTPPPATKTSVDWSFMDDEVAAKPFVRRDESGNRYLKIIVGGMYCPSCAWLLEKALSQYGDGVAAAVDLSSNSMDILVEDAGIQISPLLELIENLGYRPSLELGHLAEYKNQQHRNRDTLKRICVAGLGMMQVMTYAVAAYLGEFQGMGEEHLKFLTLVSMLVATVVVFYSGRQIFVNAITDVVNGRMGMDVPITLAILGAYLPSVYFVMNADYRFVYFDSAVMFVFLILITRFVEANARGKLGVTADSQRDPVNKISVLRNGQAMFMHATDIKVGDQATIQTNHCLPFDGRLIGDSVLVDESNITGEAEPQTKLPGETVLAGAKVLSSTAQFEAILDWEDSSIAKLEQLLIRGKIQESNRRQSDDQATRYFVLFTLVLTASVAIGWWWFQPGRTLEIALAMLVASCPCAFALAQPLAVTAAVSRLRRAGVWLSDFGALKKLTSTDIWAFDKTGTLTRGRPDLKKLHLLSNVSEDEVKVVAASLLIGVDHPFALAFNGMAQVHPVLGQENVPGTGVSGCIDGQRYWLGRPEWVTDQVERATEQLAQICEISGNSLVALANQQGCLALFELSDSVRMDAKPLIAGLKRSGQTVAILSGDRPKPVRLCGVEVGAQECFPELSAQQKKALISGWQQQGKTVVMVGDGSNDAPALGHADIAIALVSGTEVAQSQADILLMNSRLSNLTTLQDTARKMAAIIQQNRNWALLYNLLALPLAAFGYLSPLMAVTGMSISSMLVVFNASRLAR